MSSTTGPHKKDESSKKQENTPSPANSDRIRHQTQRSRGGGNQSVLQHFVGQDKEGQQNTVDQKLRHEENIQILVATGILGAYFTLLTGNAMKIPKYLTLPANIIFAVTLVFLTFKLAINSSTPMTDWTFLEPIDDYIPLVYFTSVIGSFLMIAIIFISNQLSGFVSILEKYGSGIVIIVPLALVPLSIYFGTKNRYQQADELRQNVREELPDALSVLIDEDHIESTKKESLQDRYETILDHDDGLDMWSYQNGGLLGNLVGEGKPAITNSELQQLLTIFRRIKTNGQYGEINPESVEAIEEVLQRAEHRMPAL